MVDPPRRILSACAGVDGLGIGIARAFPGAQSVCYIEREAYPAVCLASRMEEGALAPAPLWLGDIGAFPANGWAGLVDTLAASIPCQGNSVAGARGGVDDPRWLWPQTRRLLRLLRPRFFILENVPGLATVSDGRALGAVLGDLDTLGFDAAWGCLSAAEIGAHHGRDRLWLLAWRRDVADTTLRGLPIGEPVSGSTCCGHAAGACRIGGKGADGAALVNAVGGQLQRLGNATVLACPGGCLERERDQRERGRHPAGDPGQGDGRAAVEHARGDGSPWGESDGPSTAAREPRPADRCAAVDDARGGRQPWSEQGVGSGCRETRSQRAAQADDVAGPGRSLPRWPPLPDDTSGWRSVLERRPDLAPAQPAVRRVAAVRGGDDRLDVRVSCTCPRGRRIAAIGNAVCPDQCAAALKELWRRAFGADPVTAPAPAGAARGGGGER